MGLGLASSAVVPSLKGFLLDFVLIPRTYVRGLLLALLRASCVHSRTAILEVPSLRAFVVIPRPGRANVGHPLFISFSVHSLHEESGISGGDVSF